MPNAECWKPKPWVHTICVNILKAEITATKQKRFVNCEQQWTGWKLVICKHTTNCIRALILLFFLFLLIQIYLQCRDAVCAQPQNHVNWLSTWKYGVQVMSVWCSVYTNIQCTLKIVSLALAASVIIIGSVELWNFFRISGVIFCDEKFLFVNTWIFHGIWDIILKSKTSGISLA